jgi:hypothetical protein
MRLISFAL